MSWKVFFFPISTDKYPVKDFMEKQDKTIFAKIIKFIELLENYGPFLKPPYIKKISSDLYELRINGHIAVRIFYTLKNNSYYLLHAFIKKSQKTPKREIDTAVDRMRKLI